LDVVASVTPCSFRAGTGFLGRLILYYLVEYLQESVDVVYLLVRRGKGKSPVQRLKEVLQDPAFKGCSSTVADAKEAREEGHRGALRVGRMLLVPCEGELVKPGLVVAYFMFSSPPPVFFVFAVSPLWRFGLFVVLLFLSF